MKNQFLKSPINALWRLFKVAVRIMVATGIENHLDGEVTVRLLQYNPSANADELIAETRVNMAEDAVARRGRTRHNIFLNS